MPPLPNISAFSTADQERIQICLNEKLDKDDISYRPSAAGNVAYLEGWRTFNLANQVFGFNGWSSEILSLTQDYLDVDPSGKVSVGISCMVRVYLRDGTFHDDIGYGSSEGQRSKGASYEKARKEAVTDAMKRALRVFGNKLGNCAYDKVFLRDIKTQNGKPPVIVQAPVLNSGIPPADYKPAWQPARSALSAPAANHLQNQMPNQQLHSDDFDALITEADLYDLEMS